MDFANAVDASIVTSFATSVGTRDATGGWTTVQARRLLDYTTSVGGRIAAAEYMNEPTLAAMGGAPAGYDAAAYGRDFKVFRAFVKRAAPDLVILGPGSVGETAGAGGVAYGIPGVLGTADLLAASGQGVDAFSYHHYGASSIRCAAVGPQTQTTANAALSEPWLSKTDETLAFYRGLRDKFEPGRPFWNTETADAACGGNPWGGTFLDTFRYLDQLGRLAKQEVRVVAHNTLVASDYGLLEENTFTPKPNYWAALLWRRLMGTIVLESGVPIQAGLHVYAHCLRGSPGGVAVLAINTDTTAPRSLTVPNAGERFTLSTPAVGNLQDKRVHLNGTELTLGPHDDLPTLRGESIGSGNITLSPRYNHISGICGGRQHGVSMTTVSSNWLRWTSGASSRIGWLETTIRHIFRACVVDYSRTRRCRTAPHGSATRSPRSVTSTLYSAPRRLRAALRTSSCDGTTSSQPRSRASSVAGAGPGDQTLIPR